MTEPSGQAVDAASLLRQLAAETSARDGISRMSAIGRLRDELSRLEIEAVEHARSHGATWQQVADDLGHGSRQAALLKYGRRSSASLPGMSAAEMARRLGLHQQTVAASPEKHGIIVRTFSGEAGRRPRKRYFLAGDEGVSQDS